MGKNISHGIIKEILKTLAEQAGKISGAFKEDDIHKFRLGLKKLRAWLRLLAYTTGNKKIRLPLRLLRLYHIVGEIRETQIELSFLTGKGLPVDAYLELLNEHMHNKQQEWNRHYDEKILKKARKKMAGFDLPEVAAGDVKAFVSHKKKRIHRLKTQPVIADGCLHEIRKQVKDILYVREIARKACGIKMEIHARKYKVAEEQIGDYNDKNQMLRRMIAKQPTGGASKAYVDFCDESRTVLALQKQDILAHGLMRR